MGLEISILSGRTALIGKQNCKKCKSTIKSYDGRLESIIQAFIFTRGVFSKSKGQIRLKMLWHIKFRSGILNVSGTMMINKIAKIAYCIFPKE